VFVSTRAVDAVFRWEDAIAAIGAAYAAPIDRHALPARSVGRSRGSWLRTLPALPPTSRYFGAKLMGMAPAAATPRVEYVIVLFDRETSRIAAFVDASKVTAYRTAATSAAALERLAPPGTMRLAVLGSGLEASMHVRAFSRVRQPERIAVFSPTPQRRTAFADAASADLGVLAEAVDEPEAAVDGATVVLAAARSHGEVPILYGDWLPETATVVSIGSTVPEQREIDASVVARCDRIVCDDVHEVVAETGDMREAERAGVRFADKTFSLHALMSGELDSLPPARRPLFKSVGSGLQDVVVGELVLRKALEADLAVVLPIEFTSRE